MRFIISNKKNTEGSKLFKFNEHTISILFYIVSTLLSIAILFFMISAFKNVSVKANTTPTSNNVTVVIDAGHGGEDGGATANGVCEKDINLIIATKLNEIFTNAGINTIMTRSEDISLGNPELKTVKDRKKNDIKNRVKILNENSDNILISIHQNKFEQEKYSGTQIFYSKNNPESLKLAESIKKSVVNLLQPENTRETKPNDSNIYLLNNTKNIAVLVECGFLSNKEECKKLQDDEYQNSLCNAIYQGFIEYMK